MYNVYTLKNVNFQSHEACTKKGAEVIDLNGWQFLPIIICLVCLIYPIASSSKTLKVVPTQFKEDFFFKSCVV